MVEDDRDFIRMVELDDRYKASLVEPRGKERYDGGYEQWVKDHGGFDITAEDIERLSTNCARVGVV